MGTYSVVCFFKQKIILNNGEYSGETYRKSLYYTPPNPTQECNSRMEKGAGMILRLIQEKFWREGYGRTSLAPIEEE